jgi:hypothetical protein
MMIANNLMLLLLAFIGTNIVVVHALPTWESFNSRSSINSLVTGSTFLLAGGLEYGLSYYLTTPLPKGVCVCVPASPYTQQQLTKKNRLDRRKYDDFCHTPSRRCPVIFCEQRSILRIPE